LVATASISNLQALAWKKGQKFNNFNLTLFWHFLMFPDNFPYNF